MQCPRCQHENPPGMKFCGECATSLAATCPSCGAANPPESKFCGQCAAPLRTTPTAKFVAPDSYTPKHLAEKILTSKTALEGERKQVTVLFADLKGSMELLADRDPEEARKLLDPVLEDMMEAVHRYEGTVNQVMGDGIMALFGAPLAHEDHAVRACYAAMRMQEAVKRYAEEVRRSDGIEIQIRVGLNSGEVVVRAIGSDLRMDYTAVGQTTHLAARMEQLALPGTTRLTADTLELAEGYIEVRSLGLVPVKGLNAPIEVFEMVAADPGRSRFRVAAARGLTQFVGRERELEQLRMALLRAAAGHGEVVAIVGEPGIGKSRLVWEATHSHRTGDWLVVEGGAVSYGKATPYLPVRNLLKGYFGIQDQDDHREIREKVIGKLLTLDEALKSTLPSFFALLDVPAEDSAWQALAPPQRRQRTIEAVKWLLLRESQVQPVVVVVEDLHWIDPETQALLDSLIDGLSSCRLLLLVNYRPDYHHGRGEKIWYQQLSIDSLSPEGVDDLLTVLLGVDVVLEPLKRVLLERTEGNPLFLEECVRTLIETGMLTGERGAYHLAKSIESIEMPATVQAILAARIDRLPREGKALLQTAAVIGKDVPYVLLQRVAQIPEEAILRNLAHLGAAEFLYETARVPELEYTFKHTLTHEVAYGGLFHEQRRALHALVVEAMDSVHPDRLPQYGDRLAHHAFHGGLWAQALVYLAQAGERALAVAAYGPAVATFEQALASVEHLPEGPDIRTQAIDLHLNIRHALQAIGEFERSGKHLQEAERLSEAGNDQRQIARVKSFMVQYFRLKGDLARAVESGERALAIATHLDDPALRLLANAFLGSAYWARGDYRKAAEILKTCAASSDSLIRQDPGVAGLGLAPLFWRIYLVFCLTELGDFTEGIGYGEEAMRLAEAGDHQYGLIFASWGLGTLALLKGDVAQAVALLERGLTLCRSLKVLLAFPPLASSLGAAYSLSGRSRDAIALLEEAVRAGVSMTRVEGHALLLARLGEAYLLAGRIGDAHTIGRQALQLAREKGQRGHEAYALSLLGDIASREPLVDIGAAEASCCQAFTLAEELSMRPLVAHCHLGLGKLYRRAGKAEQAHEHFVTATTMYREMDMRFWLEKAAAELC
jgi:predicted ATPase/class 3 adenylate cyclase